MAELKVFTDDLQIILMNIQLWIFCKILFSPPLDILIQFFV